MANSDSLNHPETAYVKELLKGQGFSVHDYHCIAGPKDRPFTEEHSFTSINIVRSGSFCYKSHTSKTLLSTGGIFIGKAKEEYICSHEHSKGDDSTVIELAPEIIEDVSSAIGFQWDKYKLSFLPPLPKVEALHKLIWNNIQNKETTGFEELVYIIASAVLKEVALAHNASNPFPLQSADKEVDKERIQAAIYFIESHSNEELSLQKIAKSAYLSPFHFLRIFKKEMGLTPHQYLIRTRLRRAIHFLRDTSLPITDIAYEIGFLDLSNFVRTFHTQIGCSPRNFRQGKLIKKIAIFSKKFSVNQI